MRKILFAVALALPVSWSLAAFAEDAPAAPADAKTDTKATGRKNSKKGVKKTEKKVEDKKTAEDPR
jgi:hypothetical protein